MAKLHLDAPSCARSGCNDPGKHSVGTTLYCDKHYAITNMRGCARRHGKYVPEFFELVEVWPKDDCCPRCSVQFAHGTGNDRGAAYGRAPSLQHFKPSPTNPHPIAIVCHSCNHSLLNLGDTLEAMDAPLGVRKCKKCEELKPESEFSSFKRKESGNWTKRSNCRLCEKIRLALSERKRTAKRRADRAAAHRAMARAALFADSSASTRLKRYNHHAEKARRLEAAARGQEVAS